VDRTDWFLALLTFFVAGIALQTVSGATSGTFGILVGVPALLVVAVFPFYVLYHALGAVGVD
jgi:hypothetical protein